MSEERLKKIEESINKIATSVNSITNEVKNIKSNPLGLLDADLNQDGKVTAIEIMAVKTLQGVAQKTQKNNIYILLIILGFLLVQAILAALGISVSL